MRCRKHRALRRNTSVYEQVRRLDVCRTTCGTREGLLHEGFLPLLRDREARALTLRHVLTPPLVCVGRCAGSRASSAPLRGRFVPLGHWLLPPSPL